MSLFKKDLQEHYDFFAKCYDYILTKQALSKAGAMRFAGASDLMSLNVLEKFYNSISENDINKRLAQVETDISSIGKRLKMGLRKELGVPSGVTFSQFKKENKDNDEFNTLKENLKINYLQSRAGNQFISVISLPLTNKVTAAAKAMAASRLKGKLSFDEAEEAARSAVVAFLDGTAPTSLVDYLVDFPSSEKSLNDIVTMYASLITRSQLNTQINDILNKKGISLDESLEGKGDSSTTRGEQLQSEEKSVEEQATATPTDSLKRFLSLYGQATSQLRRRIQSLDPAMDANQIKILNLELSAAEAKIPVIKATKDLLDKVDGLLATKSRLFEQNKSKILSEEEIQSYSSVDEQLRSDLARVSEMLSEIAPSSAEGALANVRENINDLAMEYTIPGLTPEPIAEIAEPEEDDALALPGAKKARKPRVKPIPVGMTAVSPQAYQAFMDKGSQYLEEMIPDLYAGLHYAPGSELQQMYGRGPFRSIDKDGIGTKAIPYARGLQTKAQLEAIQSGDADEMQAAGVDVISQFKRELLSLMSEQNLNYIWQQSGRTVPGAEGFKKSSRKIFNQKLEELRQDPRFASNPDISGPGGMIDQYLKTPGAGQETFDQFDMVRRSAEYMRALRESGKSTFAELTDEDIEAAAENAINREGSHYGENQAMWLKGHKPYFGLSPEVMKAIMVKELAKLRADSPKEGARSIKFTDIEMQSTDLQPKNVGYKGRQKATPEIIPDVTPDVEASSRRFKRFASAEPAENVDFMANNEDLLDIWKNNPDLRGELSGLLVD